MQIKKLLKHFFIGILCVFFIGTTPYAATNIPTGDIGEYGNWLTEDNVESYHKLITADFANFQNNFTNEDISSATVPLEVKLGFSFMKAFSAINTVLKLSLIPFTIIFLLVMYAFWVGLEGYKLIRDSGDYKKALYDIITKGLIISVWILVLNYDYAIKILEMIIDPIMSLGVYLSDFILNSVANTYDVKIPATCAAIHNYVDTNNMGDLLINSNTAANIMCLPARISAYFYHAISLGFKWMVYGFTHSLTAVIIGGVSIYVFIKCVFKYAFMTLGVVADLFLTLLKLPFTAIAESMPASKESNYAGQIFGGLLKLFKTDKLSDVIAVFINAAIYFVTLSIVIAVCAVLLSNVMYLDSNGAYSIAAGMTSLLTGYLVLYLAGKADELAKQIGGKIDNSFGKSLQSDSKTMLGGVKKIGGMIFKDWLKK